jgi:SAM-dependent methyltransferase
MTRELWDREARTFDQEPDHGLSESATRAAWRDLLLGVLPTFPARIADLGCGTGTLTRLLVDEGFDVDGLDFSPEMIKRAREKVPEARFVVGDAADPALEPSAYDAVLSRHVLWAMPDPAAAFAKWIGLLKPGGIAILIEGSWSTGAGLTAARAAQIVRSMRTEADVRLLTESVFWGKEISDERFLIVSER